MADDRGRVQRRLRTARLKTVRRRPKVSSTHVRTARHERSDREDVPGLRTEEDGPTDVLDDGTRTVSGRFKIPNGWTFDDYDHTRKLLADSIAALAAFD